MSREIAELKSLAERLFPAHTYVNIALYQEGDEQVAEAYCSSAQGNVPVDKRIDRRMVRVPYTGEVVAKGEGMRRDQIARNPGQVIAMERLKELLTTELAGSPATA